MRALRDAGYAAPSAASPYRLAAPDSEPLPAVTRSAIEWRGDTWRELNAAGAEIDRGCGESGEHVDRQSPVVSRQ